MRSLSQRPLEVVPSYRYLGVVLTPSLRWDAHVAHILARGHRLFAKSTSWARSKGLPASFSHFLLSTYVLPSATFGTEFVGNCTRILAQLDLAQRRWGRHLLGWASGTPCASVLYEFALPDSIRLSTGRALALFGRLHSRAFLFLPQCLLSRRTLQEPGPTGVSLFSNTTLKGIQQILVSGRAALQRSPADGCTALSIPCWIERGFIVSVAPSSLVSASTLELSVPTRSTMWSTIPLLILVWPGGGAWRGILVVEQPGTEVMCLSVRSVPAHPGSLSGDLPELFPPKPPCGLGIHGSSTGHPANTRHCAWPRSVCWTGVCCVHDNR